MLRQTLSLPLLLILVPTLFAQGTKADYERAASLRAKYAGKVFRDKVEPHWFANGDRFWYDVKLPDGKSETVLVDAVAGTKLVVSKESLPKGALTDPKPVPAPQPFRGRKVMLKSPDDKWMAQIEDHNVEIGRAHV